MKLNSTHLAKVVAEQTGLSQAQSSRVIAAMAGAMARSLAVGDDVKIAGFGKFRIRQVSGRIGRHPRTGEKIAIKSRRTVGFSSFQALKNRINGRSRSAPERRLDSRRQPLPRGRAVVRISGIPVCEFPVKDISGNGTSILVPRDAMVLRNLRVGQQIEIYMIYNDGRPHTVMQRCRIAHITPSGTGSPYLGQVVVGLKVVDRL